VETYLAISFLILQIENLPNGRFKLASEICMLRENGRVSRALLQKALVMFMIGISILTLGIQRAEASGSVYGWEQTYGGTKSQEAFCVIQTSDGGYALAGFTESYGAGAANFWLVKTDASGNEQWTRTYGGSKDDEARCVIQTSDGGYALAGYTTSFGAGGADFWLVKTDARGNELWAKTYGGPGDDVAYSVVQTSDGGYALAGYTTLAAGNTNYWLVRTDSDGNEVWNKTFGGGGDDVCYSMIKTDDGGFALAGKTSSFSIGFSDLWLVKTDAYGNEIWNQTYGGYFDNLAYSVIQTSDEGYALAGTTDAAGAGGVDMFLVKANSTGDEAWNKTYGGPGYEEAWSVVQTKPDGGYALGGSTTSYGAGGSDFWLVKTDSNGNTLWNQTYGGARNDTCYSMIQTSDGGYALAGSTASYGPGPLNFWLVKTDQNGAVSEFQLQYTLVVSVQPAEGGTTSPIAGSYSYPSGKSVDVTVSVAKGFNFEHWTLDGVNVGQQATYTVLMNENHTLTAYLNSPSGTPMALIVGGVVVAVIVIAVALALSIRRRKSTKVSQHS
jgi:predicted secreted protein